MKKTTFIYALFDPLTEESRYIGKSNRPSRRFRQHLTKKRKKSHRDNWIQSILNDGREPYYYVIDEVPMDEWEYWEKYWIEQYLQWGFKLTNETNGGQGAIGYSHTDKTKEKMRQLKLGIPLSDEHKKKISTRVKEYHKENPSYNMKGNNERTFIDRDLLYDLYIVQNLSMPQISDKLNISEKKIFENLHLYNIHKKDGWWLDGLSKKYKKVVLQYDLSGNLLREWDGIVDITNDLGYNGGNIANCCRGVVKTSNGFIWRYKDEWFDLNLPNLMNKSKMRTHLSVIQKTLDGEIVAEYDTIREAVRNGFKSYSILRCCDGKANSYKGFQWSFN